MSVRQLDRYLRVLKRHRLIEVEQVGLNKPNKYRFLEHPWMALRRGISEPSDMRNWRAAFETFLRERDEEEGL